MSNPSTRSESPADSGNPTIAAQPTAITHVTPAPTPGEAPSTIPEQVQPQFLPTIPGYTLMRSLGRGGMGVVYLAHQARPSRQVALKTMIGDKAEDPAALERFRRESEVLGQLRHPNIVPVYEVGEAAGRAYFSMEFQEGGGLNHRLNGTPQPARLAATVAETLARAVHAAHQAGVVHRDLKPANVLIAEPVTDEQLLDRQTFKIADFGLAKRLEVADGPTRTGAILGTPSYMAPEQASGTVAAIGPATDVYALGAILYELLTGRPPFRAATPWDTLEQVMKQDPVPPSRLQPGLPRDLETVCLKCLEKSPQKRYAAAAELADDLRRYLDGKSVTARRPSTPERAAKWAKRNPGWATVVALAVVATIAIGVVIAFWIQEIQDAAEERTRFAEERTRAVEVMAQEERDRANEKEQFATQLATERNQVVNNLVLALQATEDLLTPLDDQNLAYLPGMKETARVQIAKALPLLNEAVARSQSPPVKLVAAKVFNRIAMIQRQFGEYPAAEETLDRAISLLDRATPEQLTPVEREVVVHSHYLRALTRGDRGNWKDALADTDRIEQIARFEFAGMDYELQLAQYRIFRGGALTALSRYPEAQTVLKQAESALRQAASRVMIPDARRSIEVELARAIHSRGEIDSKLARRAPIIGKADQQIPLFQSAIAAQREALEIRTRIAAVPNCPPQRREDLGYTLQSLAGDLAEMARAGGPAESLQEAEEHYQAAITVFEELTRDYPTVPAYRYKLGSIQHHLAFSLTAKPGFDPDACSQLLDGAEANLRLSLKDSQHAADARYEVGDLHFTRIVVAMKTNDLFGGVRAAQALAAEPGNETLKRDEWRKAASILAFAAWGVLKNPDRPADIIRWLAEAWMVEARQLILKANGSGAAAREDLEKNLIFYPIRAQANWPALRDRLVPP